MSVNPRGAPSWPTWREAQKGQRVRHVRTRWTGSITFVQPVHGSASHVMVRWDQSGAIGAVVSPAFDLEPINDLEVEIE